MIEWWSVAALALGLVLIFVAGFASGVLWNRGDHVRRVMTGEEPPPWDDEPVFIPEEWEVPTRRGVYNWANES